MLVRSACNIDKKHLNPISIIQKIVLLMIVFINLLSMLQNDLNNACAAVEALQIIVMFVSVWYCAIYPVQLFIRPLHL